jgi:hypothetical protein
MRGDFANSSMTRLGGLMLKNLAISVHPVADENGIFSHPFDTVVFAPGIETF